MDHTLCVYGAIERDAISNNKDIQVMSKKNWLKDRLDEGLVFLKGNVRGKCFIEYIPAEYAWAEGYMYIDCLWVFGQFKGHGYSNLLLDACIKDSKEKGKKGLVILSSKKKMGFSRRQRPGTLRFNLYIFRPERMRKGVPRPLQPFPFSMTGSL